MITEELKISTGESIKTVKELKAELKELKNQLINTEKGTEEYNQTLVKAANITHDLKEMQQEVSASSMDFGDKLGNCTKALTGISGAITAATGTLSLFGVENEEAQKKITATMSAMIGITEGISKIDEGVKAFKRLKIVTDLSSSAMGKFKLALIGTGLGAIVVILGSVIANWEDFTKAIGLSSDQLDRLKDIAKGVFNVLTSGMKQVAIALGKMLKGDFAGAWEELKKAGNVVEHFNQGVEKSVKDRNDKIAAENKKAADKAKKEAEKKAKELAAKRKQEQREAEEHARKLAEIERKRIEGEAKLAKYNKDMSLTALRGDDADKYSEQSIAIWNKYFEQLKAIYKEGSDEYKQVLLEQAQFEQGLENQLIKEKEDAEKKKTEAAKKEHEDRVKTLGDFNNSLMTEQEQLDAKYKLLIDAAEKEGQDTTKIKEWYEQEKTKITEEEAEKQRQILQKSIQTYSGIAGGIGDIIGSIGDMMEEGSEQQKGMATAAATIQMLVGITTALSGAFTSKSGPWDWVLAGVQAASIAASGIAQIKKINEVKTDGSSSTTSPSISMPAVNVANSDFTQSIDGATTQSAIQDQRVYVTESDISSTQKKVAVTESAATY